MNKIKYLIIGIMVISLCLSCDNGKPMIKIYDSNVYLDTLKSANAVYHHKTKIENIGTGKLRLLRLDKDCGCMTVICDKKVLKQGDTATLNVTINAINSSPSTYFHSAGIYSNSIKSKNYYIHFHYTIVK